MLSERDRCSNLSFGYNWMIMRCAIASLKNWCIAKGAESTRSLSVGVEGFHCIIYAKAKEGQ